MKTGVLGSKYTWLAGNSGGRLHYVPGIDDDRGPRSGVAFWDSFWDGWIDGKRPVRDLPAACGARIDWILPGIFSRMGLPRCSRCCRALGVAQGKGVPFNDRENVVFLSAVLSAAGVDAAP